jgi:hypothetical protein
MHMSYSSIEVVCEGCGCIINKIVSLKSIKDILRPMNDRCGGCGVLLNPSEFSIKVQRK